MFLRRLPLPASGTPAVAVSHPDGSWRSLQRDSDALLQEPLDTIRSLVAAASERGFEAGVDVNLSNAADLPTLPPVTGRTEVWAAGVTYERSRAAREEESEVADVYARVYDADRPELFFKSVSWKVVSDGDAIGIRADSPLNVPEPEVALLVNAHAEVVGYTICNDVSSRSIEGANPLYLPQAKVYQAACAIAPAVRLAWDVSDPDALDIHAEIRRGDAVVWSADGTTARMHRRFTDLVQWAYRGDTYPAGILLSTGTMLVPDLDTTLLPGDTVTITIPTLGTLTNPVTLVGTAA